MTIRTIEQGETMLGTLEGVEQKDIEKFKKIAQLTKRPLKDVFHQVVEDLEQSKILTDEDDPEEQAIDEAIRSPRVRSAFNKLNDTCKNLGL